MSANPEKYQLLPELNAESFAALAHREAVRPAPSGNESQQNDQLGGLIRLPLKMRFMYLAT
jgi:hypothetical protein